MAFIRNENVYVGTVRVSMYASQLMEFKTQTWCLNGKITKSDKTKKTFSDDYLYVFSNISSIVVLFLFFLFEYLFFYLYYSLLVVIFFEIIYISCYHAFPWHFVLSRTGGLKQPLKRCEIVFNEYLIW